MEWFCDLLWKDSIAHTILIYSIVIAVGVALGKIRVYGISLGITWVLFAGILAGHLGFAINHDVLDFAREFGLILFIFSIGLQVGPGFFSSFKKGGLTLNLLAICVVVLHITITLLIHFFGNISIGNAVGIMSGAVTNTPGLGAAQEALKQVQAAHPVSVIPQISLGYAVAYPFGVLGIILTMLILKRLFRKEIDKENDLTRNNKQDEKKQPSPINLVVKNPQLFGKKIKDAVSVIGCEIVITRIMHDKQVSPTDADTVIQEGDILMVVVQKACIDEVIKLIGGLSEIDLSSLPGRLLSRIIIVTRNKVVGKKLGSLRLRNLYGLNITRINRAGVEFMASPDISLQLGDRLTVVGDEAGISSAAARLGNHMKRLEEPNIVPIFIGILLGIVLGSIPFAIPGIPMPIRLGLAGGPLIVAILLSKFGYKFRLVMYTTHSANLMLREIGIVLFLASVGINSGSSFIKTLTSGDGMLWIAYGAMITFFPIMIMGMIAKQFFKKSFHEVCGLLAGSTTDPPALAFANSIAGNDAPAVTYSTIYPLVMFLRIIGAQLLILLFS
ncbi:MAG: putative transporter [Bacteroidia bacterium]|nr:putative transporter [Bacteroidia bacterium]